MGQFDEVYQRWLKQHIMEEKSPRRRELLQKGLSRGSVDLLRLIWFPAIGNLDHLYPEYEVRDFNNGYRYLDFAYLPAPLKKGCLEVHDFRSHARDIEVSRFKDLCMKQALLALDDWLFLPIAYLSIIDDPGVCKQLVLSFVGKFLSGSVPAELHWAEAETLRFAGRLLHPFTPAELARHLHITENRTRVALRSLVEKRMLEVASGNQRYRTYRLAKMK
ncbi:MAG: transcriptional regulator [Paenibacillaceae bacterium]|nr:transcriptional regulator [Paenibacillaceae bacterium]